VRDDVLLVQTLMKLANFTRNLPGQGPVEASRNIKVDGYFGPQTYRLILAFEVYVRERRRLIIADGVFEPSSADGFTGTGVLYKIVHLNRFAKESTPFGNDYNQLPTDPKTHGILRGSLIRRG
jgi:peptidoglycan hydrolase-like protein with peptidoglycan-binding domain